MMFHPSNSTSHVMFLSEECPLRDRIHFLNDLVASEEYLETYKRVKQELKDEGVELYQDEAIYLEEICLGWSITYRENIKVIYDYIEKLKSCDSDFADFARKEILIIQATREAIMRDGLAKAIDEEQILLDTEILPASSDAAGEWQTTGLEKLFGRDFVRDYRRYVKRDYARASEEEALKEAFEADYVKIDDTDSIELGSRKASKNKEQQPAYAMSEGKSSTLRWIIRALILGGVIGLLVWYLSK